MEKPKSQQQLLMQAAWRKAFKEGQLVFKFKTNAAAIRARMALYSAVKQEKQGLGSDLELIDAAQQVEISWIDKQSFVMRNLTYSDFIQGLEEGVGEKLVEQVDPAIRESQRRLLELTQGKAKVDPTGLTVELPDFMKR